MTLSGSDIPYRTVARQATEPANAIDGMLWIDTAPDSGNSYTRSFYDSDSGEWQIDTSVGPNNPDDADHTAVIGSAWTDTSTTPATAKGYDGTAFASFGVTNHANLTNVNADQHHSTTTDTITTTDSVTLYTGNSTGVSSEQAGVIGTISYDFSETYDSDDTVTITAEYVDGTTSTTDVFVPGGGRKTGTMGTANKICRYVSATTGHNLSLELTFDAYRVYPHTHGIS